MKRFFSMMLVLALVFSLLPVLPAGAEEAEKTEEPEQNMHYSYADIVKRTYDMTYLATEPKPGEGGKQITSTDPSSQYNEETGKYENWDANLDNIGYVRYNPENGYRVLADLEGPGYVNRIWIPTYWEGTMNIYIDGELLYSGSCADFIWGSAFREYDELSFQANYHESEQFAGHFLGGIDLFVPITYNESCVIEVDVHENNQFYYIVGYYDLEDGASVDSFQWPMSEENKAALKAANDILADTSVPTGDVQTSKTVKPGETVTLYESALPGAISATALNIAIPANEFDKQTALVDWEIAMYWDGSDSPAVCMSVADFYGVPYGKNEFDSAGYGVAADGTVYSTWYMPFNAAKITLTNRSEKERSVTAVFATETLTDAEANDLTRFHANWQRAYARTDDRAPDAQMLYVEGKGRYVGTSLHVYQLIDGIWWGEGDAKIFIDGEKFPTWFDTGSEDYFCYAWCGSMLFNYPYCGQPQNDGYPSTGDKQVQGHGDKVNYRLHITDNICFSTSLESNIEKYFKEQSDMYAATTYFYLTKETSGNHVAVAPSREDRLFNNDVLTGSTLFYPGAYLSARVIDSNTSVEPWLQPMDAFEGEWYGDLNYMWLITARGKYIDYLIDIPEGGRYAFNVSMTSAPDYGKFNYYLDGELIGTVDTFSAAVAQKNVTVDLVDLTPGAHILRVESAGKNTSSRGYYMGINYLKFVPTSQEIQINEYFFGGYDDLVNKVTNNTAPGTPIGQGLDDFCNEHYTWHGKSHLFWDLGENGETTFTVEIPEAGTYCLELGRTLAVDFGKYDILVNGVKVAENVDSFRAGGVFGEVSRYYNIELTAGKQTITFVGKGKNASGTGTLIGIDYLKFTTQTEVGAFYGAYNDLYARYDADNSVCTNLETQELGWVATYVWYHNTQLRWSSEDSSVAFNVTVPAEGDYAMSLGYTCAGDYGQFEVYIDGKLVSDTVDGYSSAVEMKTYTQQGIHLTAGEHKLVFKTVGKNELATGYWLGLSYVDFLAPYTSETEEVERTTLTFEQREAYAALRAYAEAALANADELQKPHVRMTMAEGMMAISAAAPDEVEAALAAAKAAIDNVLATTYEEELEVDLVDDLFYEGADMPNWVKSYTTSEAPHGQGLDANTWSGGGHLFWRAEKVGDEMVIALDVPYAGTYTGEFAYTVAGDFGQYDIYLDDTKLGSVDAYFIPLGVKTLELGEMNLTAGEHLLKIVITGKNDASAAYFVGIDHLVFKGSTLGLVQYQAAACKYLDSYKDAASYSTEQWQVVLATIAAEKAKINACTTVEEVIAAWRAAKKALDAIETGLFDYDNPVFDETKTPADFGWSTDNGNYKNWQVTTEGEPLYVKYDGVNSKRIWKEIIQDPNNFAVKMTVKVEDLRAEIEVMGVHIELNTQHGNGNQIFDRESWDWFNAKDQIAEVTIVRSGGGDLMIKFVGQGNSTPVTFTKTPTNPSDKNVYIGVIDTDGSAFFSEIRDEGFVGQNPGDFGWDTDEPKDFSGWTATDAANVAANYDKTAGEHRIWKSLLTNQDDFTVSLDVTTSSATSAYVKVLGVTIELDGNGGNGNQNFIKVNGESKDWLTSAGCTANVKIVRENGGDLTITLTGKGNAEPMVLTAAPTEKNENLEIGLYRGVAKYENISVTCKGEEKPVTYTVTWIVDGKTTTETYEEGAMPSYKGSTDKAADSEYTYTFAGWEPELAAVTADVTYTAKYTKTPIEKPVAKYTVTWIVDGKTTTETYEEGAMPSYKGSTDKADDQLFAYTFTGWDKALTSVTADVTYTAVYTRQIRTVTPDGRYKDVAEKAWYYGEVYTATGLGLMNGVSADEFEPEENMTRAMMVTVLWRLEGSPKPVGENQFKDVKDGEWFTDAIVWAAENDIVKGVSDTEFEPEENITREQIATILYRYAEKKGCDMSKRAKLDSFPDGNKVSDWAEEALSWANAEGLVNGSTEGKETYLLPRENATRAQVAAIFVRFVANILA